LWRFSFFKSEVVWQRLFRKDELSETPILWRFLIECAALDWAIFDTVVERVNQSV